MKNFFVILALVFIGFSAQATSLHPNTFADWSRLTGGKLDPVLFPTKVQSATVYFNPVRKAISLSINFASPCPPAIPGRNTCMAVPARPVEIDLPLVSEKTDACGAKIYIAKRDARPVDGNLEQITLTDRRESRCSVRPDQVTLVELLIINAGFGAPVHTSKSKLNGLALRSMTMVR